LNEANSQSPPNSEAAQAILAELTGRGIQILRFSTDAGIINRLGQELVGKQETAVAELIKNAFDADATTVTLTFSDTYQSGGSLKIEDNGLGMSQEQLLNGFMRISSADKINHPVSERYGRRRAGRKGLGRFSVQRLGAELLLTTQTLESDHALRMRTTWDAFQSGLELGNIPSIVERVPKEREEGTTLLIRHLRDSWSEAEQNRVYRYSAEVLQPFPIERFKKKSPPVQSKQSTLYLPDPGFQITLFSKSGEAQTLVANQEKNIFAHALAVIEGYVDERGEGVWSIKSIPLKIEEEISSIGSDTENTKPFLSLRRVALKAYYFVSQKGASHIPKLLRTPIEELRRAQGGVRVYRNGFRVSPYGERGNDWTGLDNSNAVRTILPQHANANFFGFVELLDPDNKLFEELTNREGLIENNAFKELQEFTRRVLLAAAIRSGEVRGIKTTRGQKNWKNKEADVLENTPAAEIDAAVSAVDDAITEAETNLEKGTKTSSLENPQLSSAIDPLAKVKAAVSELAKTAHGVLEATNSHFLEEVGMLRVLATLGLVIGEFTHEIKQTLGAAQLNTNHLQELIAKEAVEGKILDHLAANLDRIRGYSGYFYQTVADNVNRELNPQDLRAIGREFVEAMAPSVKRVGLNLDFEARGYELFTPPMHSSELNSILFNFYSNSVKAIGRNPRSQKRMLLRVGGDDKLVFMEFADDGDGISPEFTDRIFNAFFTTSTPSSRDSTLAEEAQGSGLGLKIVADIVDVYEGEIYLTNAPASYTTCFRVEFPAYQPDETNS
jgi:signal transduction histidine kinase